MGAVRTFRLGDGRWVVAVHGELDLYAAIEARAEVARRLPHGAVIVDLLNVSAAEDKAIGALFRALRHADVTTVAEPRLRVEPGLRLTDSLASALGRTL